MHGQMTTFATNSSLTEVFIPVDLLQSLRRRH
jgi:hypothetical protein